MAVKPDWNNVTEVTPQSSTAVQTATPDWNNIHEVTPVASPQEERPSWIAKGIRWITSQSPIEQYKTIGYYLDQSAGIKDTDTDKERQDKYDAMMTKATKETNEGMAKFKDAQSRGETYTPPPDTPEEKIVQDKMIQRENDIEKGSLFKEELLGGPMNLAIAVSGVAAPLKTLGYVAGFAALDPFVNLRRFVNNRFPNVWPEVKDVAELADFTVKGMGIGAVENNAASALMMSRLNNLKLPTTFNLTPEHIDMFQNGDKLKPEEKTDLFKTLGVNDDHLKQSKAEDKPINIPANKMISLVKKPYWDKVKQVFQSPSNNPTIVGAAIQDPATGKYYDGNNHPEVLQQMQDKGIDTTNIDREKDGQFRLSNGKIITREQALQKYNVSRSEDIDKQPVVKPVDKSQFQYFKDDTLNAINESTDKKFSERLRQIFSGIKNAQILRGNQLAFDDIKKSVPEKLTRQGMFWYKAANGNPDMLLTALADEDFSPYKKEIERALSLPIEAKDALSKVNQYYYEAGEISKEIGSISTVRENYQNRIYKEEPPKDYVKTEMNRGLKRSTSHAKRRIYDTEFDAVKGGKKFQTTDISEALSIHNEEMARVNTARKTLDWMGSNNVGGWHKEAPEGWEQVGNLTKSVPIKDAEGKAVIGQDGNQVVSTSNFYAPKGIAEGLKAIAEPNLVARVPLLRNIQKFQGISKTGKLAYSFFHHLSMAAQTMYEGGIGTMMHLPVMNKLLETSSFKELEEDFVRHTGMTSRVEANRDILRNLVQSDDAFRQQLEKIPGVKAMIKIADKNSEFLFGKIQRFMKVSDYGAHLTDWMAKNPEATDEEIFSAKQSMAKQTNAVYGGLNWEAMGMTKSNLAIARLFLLAPDWTISNLQLAQFAIGEGKTPAGKLSRKHLATAIIGGMVLTEGLNKILTGHFTDKNPKGHLLEVEVSPDVYVSLLRGGVGDITKAYSMTAESGLAGVSRFAQGKLSPLASTAVGALGNEKYTGMPIAKKGEGAILSTYDYLKYLIGNPSPIPLGVANVLDYIKNEKEKSLVGAAFIATGLGRYSTSNEKLAKQDLNKSLKEDYFKTKDSTKIDEALKNETITKREHNDIIKEGKMTSLQRETYHMSADKVQALYDKAKGYDKKQLEIILKQKIVNKKKAGTLTSKMQAKYESDFEKNE